MTNSSPQNPQPSEPSNISQEELRRIRQQVRRRTSDDVMQEWIAILVAFGTIGAILFWSLGGRKSNFTPLSQSSFLSSSSRTTETKANVKANVNVGSQPFASTENFDNLNITRASEDDRSEEILYSDSSAIGSLSKDNFNQKNNSFSSFPLITSVPSVTKAVIPKPAPEVIATEPESEPEVETPAISFSDVPEQYWAYPFISKLGEEKLISDSSSFEPDAPITRAGMASLISQAFKDVPSTQATKNFKDVSYDNNVVADINKAVEIGFMKGYSDENFSRDHNIPRYKVFVALATGLNLEPSNNADTILQNFSDSKDLPKWSLDKVAAATEAGLAINRPDFDLTSLKPHELATRAEVAAMIYQTLAKLGKVPQIDSQYIVPTHDEYPEIGIQPFEGEVYNPSSSADW